MASYGTSRPATERDTLHSLNGSPGMLLLGQLISASSATPVTNLTTAQPFNGTGGAGGSPNAPANLNGTLAGKMLLLQPIQAGCILTSAIIPTSGQYVAVTIQTGTNPGILIGAGERVELLMKPSEGWISWVSNAGTAATCLVWELA